MARETFLSVFARRGFLSLRPPDAPVLSRFRFDDNRVGATLSTAFHPRVTLSTEVSTGDGVNLDPVDGAAPSLGRRSDVTFGGSLRATAHLTISPSVLAARLDTLDGRRAFETLIARSKLLYQFDTAWSVRTILQWDRLAAAPSRTSLQSRRSVNADLLITYRPSPGTAVYVGLNDNLSDIDPRLLLGPHGLLRTQGRLRSDSRQVFVKASYVFRP